MENSFTTSLAPSNFSLNNDQIENENLSKKCYINFARFVDSIVMSV